MILGQEAALGVLFRNRWLNELVGDWLIHFPFSSATHHIRQQLLTHYQFPNDPDRDADVGDRPAGRVLAPARGPAASRVRRTSNGTRCGRRTYFEPNPNKPVLRPGPAAVEGGPAHRHRLRAGHVCLLLLSLYFFRDKLGDEVIRPVLTFVLPGLWVLVMVVFLVAARIEVPPRPARQGLFAQDDDAHAHHVHFAGERRPRLDDVLDRSVGGPELHRPVDRADGASTLAPILIRQWRQHGNLPPGQVAWDRTPGLLGRWLLFPLNQHRHTAKQQNRGPVVFTWHKIPILCGRVRTRSESLTTKLLHDTIDFFRFT